jgi:hypothetical protein
MLNFGLALKSLILMKSTRGTFYQRLISFDLVVSENNMIRYHGNGEMESDDNRSHDLLDQVS